MTPPLERSAPPTGGPKSITPTRFLSPFWLKDGMAGREAEHANNENEKTTKNKNENEDKSKKQKQKQKDKSRKAEQQHQQQQQ